MASNPRSQSAMGARIAASASSTAKRTYFEQQRELLMGEIAMSFEHVLANINKLNRSLEAVITVGNEFSSVEALWSQFESVMAKEEQPEPAEKNEKDEDENEQGEEEEEDETADENWEQTTHVRTRSDASKR